MNPDASNEDKKVIELDSEIQLLQHKLEFIKGKEVEIKLKSRGMVEKIEKAKENESAIELKESVLIEKAKRVYGIDF